MNWFSPLTWLRIFFMLGGGFDSATGGGQPGDPAVPQLTDGGSSVDPWG